MDEEEQSSPDQLTLDQQATLRDTSVATLVAFLDAGNAKDLDALRKAEFALKVLDFVTG